jgi:hypothetical protein
MTEFSQQDRESFFHSSLILLRKSLISLKEIKIQKFYRKLSKTSINLSSLNTVIAAKLVTLSQWKNLKASSTTE